jgi:hypothetical protein
MTAVARVKPVEFNSAGDSDRVERRRGRRHNDLNTLATDFLKSYNPLRAALLDRHDNKHTGDVNVIIHLAESDLLPNS